MALLERVATLIRANLNDLIDKAEDPEKMLKQVILDMRNQLLQVKTQVAIAIADQHVLEKKRKENEDRAGEWTRKAELAVAKQQDDLARASLERSITARGLAANFAQQVADQKIEVENLKTALHKLEQKLSEAEARAEVLVAQHRRARAVGRASKARLDAGVSERAAVFGRMSDKVVHAEALGRAQSELATGVLDDRLADLEREDEIERMLNEIKARNGKS